jgi:hypothetical protein
MHSRLSTLPETLPSDGQPSKRQVLLEVLEERKHKWDSLDKAERLKHQWTQSDVFYATRKRMIEMYHYSNEEMIVITSQD